MAAHSSVLDRYADDAWGSTQKANVELWQAKLAAARQRLEGLLPDGVTLTSAGRVDVEALARLSVSSGGQLWSLIHYGESLLLQAFVGGGGHGAATSAALAYLEAIEQLAEQHLRACSSASSGGGEEAQARAAWQLAEAEAVCGEIALGRVLLMLRARQWLKLLFPLKASWGHYERAHALAGGALFALHQRRLFPSSHAGFIDADEAQRITTTTTTTTTGGGGGGGYVERALASRIHFGVGLFQFGGSLLPPTFLWIAEALGFHGDRQLALQSLRAAAGDRQCNRWLPATLLLAGYSWFFGGERGETAAAEAMERLRAELQPSAIMEMIAGHISRRFGRLDDALAHFRAAIEHGAEIEQFQITADYEISNVHWFRGDYAAAAAGIRQYLDRSTNMAYRCYAAYKLGFCLWKTRGPLPETVAAVAELYAAVPAWVDAKMSHDRYALRKTQQWLASRLFDRFELEWIPANAAYQGCMYQRCLDLLAAAVAVVKDKSVPAVLPLKDRLAMCFYLRGCAYAGLKNYQDAAANFQNLFQLDDAVEVERWVVPYGFVETASLFLSKRNPRKAVEYLDKARSYPHAYDLDKPLSFRIKKLQTSADRMLEKLKQSS